MSMATRIDAKTGIEERLEHVHTPRGLVYSWTAVPVGARSCVLICSSIFGDFASNYHRERLLGLELSMRGCGAIRFHYTGEGNSQGDRRDMTFSSLCDDARAVLDLAISRGFEEFILMGTRVGTHVAASVAASMPTSRLAFWEPVADPLFLMKDAQRAMRMSQTVQGGRGKVVDWRQQLKEQGVVDLLGYDVYPPLVDSLNDVDFLKTLGSAPRSMFIASFRSSSQGLRDPIVDTLIARGFSVEARSFDLSEAWWFESEHVHRNPELITATADWVTRDVLASE